MPNEISDGGVIAVDSRKMILVSLLVGPKWQSALLAKLIIISILPVTELTPQYSKQEDAKFWRRNKRQDFGHLLYCRKPQMAFFCG